MQINETQNIAKNALELVISQAKNRIAEKQMIQKKLTPFLFYHVTVNHLTKNIEGMIKNEEQTILMKKTSNQEPKQLKKDNMNPKDIKIFNQKVSRQKYSSILTKTVKNPKQRLCSALQTTRQKFQHQRDFSPTRPSTSAQKNIEKERYLKLQSRQKSANNETNFQSSKFRSQKAHASPIKRFNKKINQCKKLNQKSFNDSINSFETFQESLREHKLNKESENYVKLQDQRQKKQRFENLKVKFLQRFRKGQEISFDFDGDIYDLKDKNESIDCKYKPQINSKKTNKNLQNNSPYVFQKKCEDKKQEAFINQHNPLLVETKYRVTSDSQLFAEQNELLSKNINILNLPTSENTEILNPFQDSLNLNLTNNKRTLSQFQKKQLKQNKNQSDKFEFITKQSLSNAGKQKFCLNQGKKLTIQSKQKVGLSLNDQFLQNQRTFMNNYQRQISTIPYLQISEGICYKQEIQNKPKKDEPLTQYMTISKKDSLDIKNQNKSISGQRTFRSYLSFKKNSTKPVESLNQTFTTLVDKNICVKSARIHFHLKTPRQQTSQSQHSVKVFSDRNPFIQFQDSLNKNEGIKDNQKVFTIMYPKTTGNFFSFHQNKKLNQKTQDMKDSKINKTQSIFDLKTKTILKQKIHRNLFEMNAIK